MSDVAGAAGRLDGEAARRVAAALARRRAPEPADPAALRDELDGLIGRSP